jgi:hypothetical protein
VCVVLLILLLLLFRILLLLRVHRLSWSFRDPPPKALNTFFRTLNAPPIWASSFSSSCYYSSAFYPSSSCFCRTCSSLSPQMQTSR